MSDTVTFRAQLSPLQSALQHGPDGMLVKFIPQEIDETMAGELFRLQQCALRLTVKDVMGDFTVDASIPDTASAVRINKTSPQVTFHIPRGDVLTGLRLVALFGVVFTVEITGGAAREKQRKEKKRKAEKAEKGTFGRYWQAMFRHGALNHPGLREALKIPDDQAGEQVVKEHLRAQFAVDSLTFIAPSEFEAFCDDGNHPVNLASLITISRQAAAEAQ